MTWGVSSALQRYLNLPTKATLLTCEPQRRPTTENLQDEEEDGPDAHSGSDDGPTDEEASKGPLAPKQKAQPQMHRQLPSATELKTIFEASELFKSNAFKLQVNFLSIRFWDCLH
jgi:hypothetical protein